MTLIIVAILLVSYILIATERLTNVNKAAIAVFAGTVGWVLYICWGSDFIMSNHRGEYMSFLHGASATSDAVKNYIWYSVFLPCVGKASEVVLFLLATMTIVEILNNNGCFDFIIEWIRTRTGIGERRIAGPGEGIADMTEYLFQYVGNKTYDVEDSAVGQIKMKNGAVINLRASWALNMAEDRGANGQAHTMLAGTKGGLDTFTGQVRLNHIVGNEMATTMVGRVIPNFLPGFSQGPAPLSKEHDIWVTALEANDPSKLFVTAEQAYVVTKILDSIYYSSKHNKPVYFGEDGRPIYD